MLPPVQGYRPIRLEDNQVYICLSCHALVAPVSVAKHRRWHAPTTKDQAPLYPNNPNGEWCEWCAGRADQTGRVQHNIPCKIGDALKRSAATLDDYEPTKKDQS